MRTRVLIVEDSRTQAEALKAYLEEAGNEAVVAPNGEAGVEAFQPEMHDIVISDIVMPGTVDGYDVCRAVKVRSPATPVILLTSLSDPLDIIRGLEVGADNFITKPYDPGQLIGRLEALLVARRARAGTRFSMGIKVFFMGQEYTITSEREQILDLLLTTFEEAVRQNRELRDREEELEQARRELTRYAYSLEARLDRILSSIPDVLFSFSPDLQNVFYVSPAVERVFDCDPHEFTLDYWRDRLHPDDAGAVINGLRSVAQSQEEESVEYRFQGREGATRWIHATVIPVREGDQSVERIDGIARDVTERRRSQEALQQSEERFQLLFEASPAAITLTTLDEGRYVDANRAFLELTGYERDEVIGRTISDLRIYADPAQRGELVRQVLAQGAARMPRVPFRRKDGQRRISEVWLEKIQVDGRECILGLVKDVTEMRRQSDFLELLQLVTAAANEAESLEPVLQLTLDATCERTDWPVAHAFVVGRDRPELASSGIWHVEHPDRFRALRAATASVSFPAGTGLPGRVLATGEPVWIEDLAAEPDLLRIPWGEPGERVVSAFAVPVLVGREAVAVLEFLHDRRMEADPGLLAVLVQIGTQVGRVAERQRAQETRALIEAQVRQAQKMEAVGRLAGGVAHDFNNLLTVILGESELALSEPTLGAEIKEALDEIKTACSRASSLTRQLLTFSRQDVIEPRTVDLNQVVQELEKMLRRVLGEDVDLKVRLSADPAVTVADPRQVEQVLVNLAVNARDAMDGGGRIVIETSNVELDEAYTARHAGTAPGRYLLVAVSDTGSGMSPDVQARVFEPFFTTKEAGRGTGLGLSTSYGIVKQAGGHIGVYSEVGVGTTMKVFLPESTEAALAERRNMGEVPRGVETILLVEDEAPVRNVTARMLTLQGYTVRTAANAAEALAALEEDGPPDLLLSDVILPGGTGGPDLAAQARQLHPGLKVLFASGYSSDMVALHQLAEEGTALVQKPFTREVLARKVRETLDAPAAD